MTDILTALRNAAEYREGEWLVVYLDNARPRDMSPASFRSHLTSLAKQGLYAPVDGFAWGKVRA